MQYIEFVNSVKSLIAKKSLESVLGLLVQLCSISMIIAIVINQCLKPEPMELNKLINWSVQKEPILIKSIWWVIPLIYTVVRSLPYILIYIVGGSDDTKSQAFWGGVTGCVCDLLQIGIVVLYEWTTYYCIVQALVGKDITIYQSVIMLAGIHIAVLILWTLYSKNYRMYYHVFSHHNFPTRYYDINAVSLNGKDKVLYYGFEYEIDLQKGEWMLISRGYEHKKSVLLSEAAADSNGRLTRIK